MGLESWGWALLLAGEWTPVLLPRWSSGPPGPSVCVGDTGPVSSCGARPCATACPTPLVATPVQDSWTDELGDRLFSMGSQAGIRLSAISTSPGEWRSCKEQILRPRTEVGEWEAETTSLGQARQPLWRGQGRASERLRTSRGRERASHARGPPGFHPLILYGPMGPTGSDA